MKKILLFVTVILLIMAGYFFYQRQMSVTKKAVIQKQAITVYIKNPSQKNFVKYEISLGKTALDLTNEGASVKTKGNGANAYVTEINGQAALDSKKEYWAFYVNGKLAEVGAGSYIMKDGDKIEWKIEKY